MSSWRVDRWKLAGVYPVFSVGGSLINTRVVWIVTDCRGAEKRTRKREEKLGQEVARIGTRCITVLRLFYGYCRGDRLPLFSQDQAVSLRRKSGHSEFNCNDVNVRRAGIKRFQRFASTGKWIRVHVPYQTWVLSNLIDRERYTLDILLGNRWMLRNIGNNEYSALYLRLLCRITILNFLSIACKVFKTRRFSRSSEKNVSFTDINKLLSERFLL